MEATPAIALDRRTIDQDGRLHAPRSRISKANVCPYLGREIPNYQTLGLDPNRVYQMYRTPELLQAAVDSFHNVPLMDDHVMVTADKFPEDRIAGTVSNPVYEHPYLLGDVTAWTREAIDGINSGSQKELSCAYRYVASMIAGTSPDGVRYDGRMEPPAPGIGAANHVALVEKGRAGPDVVVADGALRMTTKTRFPQFVAALAAIFGTMAKPEQLAAMDTALDADLKEAGGVKHCVADEFPNLSAEDKAAAKDNALKALGRDSLTDEEERDAYQRAAKDKDAVPHMQPPGVAKDAAIADAVKLAVDAALVTARDGYVLAADAAAQAAAAADAARAEVHALYAAREDVADKCGEVALDSAEAVYRFALDKLAIPHKDVPASALAALYAGVKSAPLAQDSAAVKPFRAADVFTPLS